jgi:hypothetical protein
LLILPDVGYGRVKLQKTNMAMFFTMGNASLLIDSFLRCSCSLFLILQQELQNIIRGRTPIPKIPTYENQQVGIKGIQVGTPEASIITARMPEAAKMPEAAFGKDVAESQVKLGGALQGLGKIIGDHVVQLQEEENKRKVLEAETKTRQALDSLLTSNEQDENGNPIGVLTKTGGQAVGVTKYYDDTYKNKIRKEILAGMDNDAQKTLASQVLDSQYVQRRSTVVQHEVQQGIKFKMDTLQASLQQDAAEAPAMDIKTLQNTIANGYKKIKGFMSAQGASPEEIDMNNKKYAGSVLAAKIDNLLLMNNDWKTSKDLLEAYKGQIEPKIYDSAMQDIKKKELLDKGIAIYNSLKGMKGGDGYPDEMRMKAAVEKLPGLNSDEREQMVSYVLAKAGEDRQLIMQHRSAQEQAFMNQISAIKQKGGGLDAALMLTSKYGYDNYSKEKLKDAAEKFFSAEGHTDPTIYMNLWKGVQEKTIKEEEIDKAMKLGQISASKWQELKKDYYTKTYTQEEKNIWDRIEVLANTKYDKSRDKEKRDAFLLEVKEAAAGKSPEDTWKIANDKLKDVKVGWIRTEKQFEIDTKSKEAKMLAFGTINEDLGGADVVKAIGQGVMATGKKELSLQDIEEFGKQLGGYGKLKAGTPVNNAIRTLMANKKMVNVKNINLLLEKYPEGIVK